MEDADGNKSTMYPIMTVFADEVGSDYNKNGIALEVIDNDSVNREFLETTRKLTYNAMVYRNNGVAKIVKSLTGLIKTKFTLEDAVDPLSQENKSIQEQFVPTYYSKEEGPGFRYPDFGGINVHQNMLEQVQTMIIEKEAAQLERVVTTVEGDTKIVAGWMDFIETSEEAVKEKDKGLVNVLNFTSTSRVPYYTVEFDKTPVTDVQEVRLSLKTPIYLEGGQDGTVTWDNYQTLFKSEMEDYLDPYSKKQSLALNPDTIMYDPTWQEQLPIAKAIMAKMALTPESQEWNTPFARGFIVLGQSKPIGVNYNGYVPSSYDVASKFANYFGNKHGWKTTADFFSKGANAVDTVEIVEPKFIPEPLYDKLYKDGIIWPYNSDRTSFLFPSFRSTYADSTSVLSNPRVIFAWIKARISDSYFDNKVSADVKIEFTDVDNTLGFSWTIHYTLYGNSQLTVANGIIDVERLANKGVK